MNIMITEKKKIKTPVTEVYHLGKPTISSSNYQSTLQSHSKCKNLIYHGTIIHS